MRRSAEVGAGAAVGVGALWVIPKVTSIAAPGITQASPPPDKACPISISGSMEGNLKIKPGDQLQGGYHFKFSGNHPASTVTVKNATVTIHAICPDKSTHEIVIPLPTYTVTVPANNTSYFPAANQSDPLVWQGTLTAPAICGAGVAYTAPKGATFTANVVISPPSTLVSFQFHYRNHATNLNGGSWSSTKTACKP